MYTVATGLWPVFAALRFMPAEKAHRAVATDAAGLTFGELEPFPRTGLPGFFPLFHARIASQQTLDLERAAQIYIDLKQSARNRELRRAGLSHDAAATRVNE